MYKEKYLWLTNKCNRILSYTYKDLKRPRKQWYRLVPNKELLMEVEV